MAQASSAASEEKSDRTKAREAFFLEFAQAIRSHFPDLALMVTGGFRSRRGMEAAVAGPGAGCDMVGIARPAAVNPALPRNIVFNKEVKDEDARLFARKARVPWILKKLIPSVGAGAESVSPACFFFSPRCTNFCDLGLVRQKDQGAG